MSWWELALVALVALPLALLLQDWRASWAWLVFHLVAMCFHLGALLFLLGLHVFSLWLSLVTVASSFRRGLREGFRRRWFRN